MKKGKLFKTIAVLCVMCVAAMPLLSNASMDVSSKDACSTQLTASETTEISGGLAGLAFMLAVLAIDAGLIGVMWATYMSASGGSSCSCGGCGCGC